MQPEDKPGLKPSSLTKMEAANNGTMCIYKKEPLRLNGEKRRLLLQRKRVKETSERVCLLRKCSENDKIAIKETQMEAEDTTKDMVQQDTHRKSLTMGSFWP
ncbi:hypothetical protein NDU88_009969 [Pleurodeles waltl]|uniref:Uncharacterized protein n=1 Tax=Pleurodeles waltl TaxID=8319 RepID=A0AAV7PWQ6_PLEWA|nr:hypothetical protein NDU88_009969 [Pleurodeles waltl]